MDKALLLFVGGVFGALAVFLFYLRKDDCPPDEEDETRKIQALIYKVEDIIDDIKGTV